MEIFASTKLEALAKSFHYVKVEYTRLWHQMNGYYVILEDREGVAEHKEQLITWAKAILTVRQESGSVKTHLEEVVKMVNANVILQQQTPFFEAL